MDLEDLVDINALSLRLAGNGHAVVEQWSNTALEIARDKWKDISHLRTIYHELNAWELDEIRIITFIRELLRIMPSIEAQQSLVRQEAFQEKKN